MTEVEQRLAELESLIVEQRDQLEAQARELADFKSSLARPVPDEQRSVSPGSGIRRPQRQEPSTPTRRTLFKVGLAAAAAATAAPLVAKTASAADGGNMIIGGTNTSTTDTVLNASGVGQLTNSNILTVTDGLTSASYPAAVGAYAQGDRVRNGLYAFTNTRDNTNVSTGHAVVARMASGGRSHLFLPSGSGDPRNDSFAHTRGEVRSTSGNIWCCVASGSPGTWRKLTGVAASGALHAISPRRVYDSRHGDGPLAVGADRTISVADSLDIETGAISGFGIVPSGATAVQFNLTIDRTVGAGWLAAAPGSASEVEASSINWTGTGGTAANATMSTLDASRQLRVFAGGATGASTHFLVDITAYTL